MINYFMMKGEIMKIKRRLLFIIYGILIISLGILSPVYADGKNTSVKVETVALKEKVKKNKKKTKKRKKKNNRVDNKTKRKNKKNKKNKKQDKKNKKKSKRKAKKGKKGKKGKKDNMDVKEKEEVEKLPETDKYKPETKNKDKEDENSRGYDYYPSVGNRSEKLSSDYILFCDYTDKSGSLKFKSGNTIALPEKGYIGLKVNGENNGKETEINWSGSSLQNIKNGIKGSYTLTAVPKENIIIGGKDYGMVKFVVNIIVE